MALDRLECNALLSSGSPSSGEAVLVKPQTFMNRSGYSLRCLVQRHDVLPEDCLVIYDEVRLPLGRTRFRTGGSPGGHRGMESVINNLHTEAIPRLRMGVGTAEGEPPGEDLVEYVLEPFREDENEEVEALIERAADACEAWLEEEPQLVMNKFNG